MKTKNEMIEINLKFLEFKNEIKFLKSLEN